MINKLLKNATVKNAGWIIAGRLIQMLISLVVGLLSARYLGPSNYGLINYASAYTAFFMAFCTLGINSLLVKEFVDHPEEEGKIIGSALALRAISSFLSAGVIIAIVCIVDADEPTTIAVAALYTIGLIFQIFETFNYWFQSKLKSKVTAIVGLVSYMVMAAYKIALLAFGKSVLWFAFATSLEHICVGVLLLIMYRHYGGKRLEYSKEVSRRILSKSVYFILPGLMVAIYGYSDKLMLKHMLSQTEVGYYSTATTIAGLYSFVLTAIIDSVYPSVMSAWNVSKEQFENRNRQLYAVVFYVAFGFSLLLCIFGEIIVVILYGKSYLDAVQPLRIVTWYTAFSYLGVARNAWIVCEDKQRYLKYIYCSSAICNVILNLILIPRGGASGAAAATLITQITTVFVVPFFIKPLRRNSVLMLEAVALKGIKKGKTTDRI